MKTIITWVIGLVAVLALVLASVALVGGNQQQAQLGAATPGTRFPHGITIGLPANSPTNIGSIITTTCDLVGTGTSQGASSTKPYSCAVTGLTSSYIVMAQLASSTMNGLGAWVIASSKASTTAGFADIVLYNASGVAAAPSAAGIGTSTAIYGFLPQ